MLQDTNRDDVYLRMKHIVEKLTQRNVQLVLDEQILPEPIVMFNGNLTCEGFESEILQGDLPEMMDAVRDFEFFELDKFKVQNLKNHFINRLLNTTIDPIELAIYNNFLDSISPEQKILSEAFVQSQTKIRQVVVDEFSTGLPSENQNPKVKWCGSLLQFAELLVELEDKEWVEAKSILSLVNSIASGFDFSNSQEKESDHKTAVDTIYRNMHFKEVVRFGKKVAEYSKLYKDNYIPMFDGIASKSSSNQ